MAYLRCSTIRQDLEQQRRAIARAGWEPTRVFEDFGASGAKVDRPGLAACLGWVREGDTLVVVSLSRLGRSTRHVLEVVDDLRERGVRLVSVTEGIDVTTPMGRAFLTIIAALAQAEREWTRERVNLGLAAARERGVRLGRPPSLSPDQKEEARERRRRGESVRSIAAALGCSRSAAGRAVAGVRPNPDAG